jgi:hypothetical protein
MMVGYFERIKNYDLDLDNLGGYVRALMMQGDIAYFIEGFFAEIVQKFPGDFFKDVNESFYRGLLFHLLYNSLNKKQYEILPEYNLPGGTVDIMLRTFPGAAVRAPLRELIEIKRVKKSASDQKLESKLAEGVTQVAGYRSGDYSDWRGVAVCFRGNKDYRLEFVE